MTQIDTTHANKYSGHANEKDDAKTGLYGIFMGNMDNFTIFGFLLYGMAYQLMHEKHMPD